MTTPVIGHQETLAMFDRLMRTEALAHAYLLLGPASVGKATVACWVAQRLLCDRSRKPVAPTLGPGQADSRKPEAPCGMCEACAAVARGTHPDVLRIAEASPTIGIDAVREWVTALSRSSLLNGWVIAIMEDVERLTGDAANACLKAIEEPPARRVILLTAAHRAQVLPTIRSRAATVQLHRVPTATIASALRDAGVTDAGALAAAADGCPGTAIAWARNPALRASAEARTAAVLRALHGTYAERLRAVDALVRKLPDDRGLARQETLEIVRAFRRIAAACTSRLVGFAASDSIPNSPDAPVGAGQLPTPNSPRELLRWMEVLARASAYVHANVAPRLVLESIVLAYP